MLTVLSEGARLAKTRHTRELADKAEEASSQVSRVSLCMHSAAVVLQAEPGPVDVLAAKKSGAARSLLEVSKYVASFVQLPHCCPLACTTCQASRAAVRSCSFAAFTEFIDAGQSSSPCVGAE
jgi:hypothetical protein